MSIDPSLKIKGKLDRHRNVLSRAERIAQLQAEERWTEELGATGLPKVSHRKVHSSKKTPKSEETAEGEEAATEESA
jgi:small basic protein (TIGR04137 family)